MSLLNFEMIWLAVNNLRLHKLRSLLTALGIIFGVSAVICMLSISEGVTADELRMIQLLGTRNIILNSVRPPSNTQASEGNTRILEYGIRYADMEQLAATVPHIQYLVPVKTVAHSARRRDRRMDVEVSGALPDMFKAVQLKVRRGGMLTDEDERDAKTVCVIGHEVQRRLFGLDDPMGEVIFVERYEATVPFTVVGVLTPVRTAGAPRRDVQQRDVNAEILIPYATATSRYGDTARRMSSGSREFTRTELSSLFVSVDELENVLAVSEMVGRIFQLNHDKQDFDMRVPLRSLQLAERKKRNSQYLLGFIASISLLVGGIGIMNIMLATVTERTREIGIRRALGARQRHITVQFLIETAVLSTGGGLVGVALGYAGSIIINRQAGWGEAIVQPWSILVSFGLSVMVGIVFGLWPAVKASRLDPIEALRFQ